MQSHTTFLGHSVLVRLTSTDEEMLPHTTLLGHSVLVRLTSKIVGSYIRLLNVNENMNILLTLYSPNNCHSIISQANNS